MLIHDKVDEPLIVQLNVTVAPGHPYFSLSRPVLVTFTLDSASVPVLPVEMKRNSEYQKEGVKLMNMPLILVPTIPQTCKVPALSRAHNIHKM